MTVEQLYWHLKDLRAQGQGHKELALVACDENDDEFVRNVTTIDVYPGGTLKDYVVISGETSI